MVTGQEATATVIVGQKHGPFFTREGCGYRFHPFYFFRCDSCVVRNYNENARIATPIINDRTLGFYYRRNVRKKDDHLEGIDLLGFVKRLNNNSLFIENNNLI